MIKAKELRIGNWVNDVGSMTFKIDAVDIVALSQTEAADKINIHYNSIPLTPEILEKCGFQFFAWPPFLQFTHFIKDDYILRQTDSGYSFFNTSACNGRDRQFLVVVHYLHQLQNLFFALAGAELEFNYN